MNEQMSILILILKILAAAFTFIGLYRCFVYLQVNSLLHRGVMNIYSRLSHATGNRRQVERQVKALYGEVERKDRLSHIEENIRYSGLARRYQFLTPELVMLFIIIIMSFIALVCMFLKLPWYMTVGAEIVAFIVIEMIFRKKRKERMKKTEDELLTFVNAVDGYAGMSDDIIHILENASGMLSESSPMREEIITAVASARNSGQESAALSILMANVEHPFFKTFIRNLEISSRNNANYKDIVSESRGILKGYIDNTKKLENIYRNGRIRMILMLISFVMSIFIIAGMVLMTVKELLMTIGSYKIGAVLLTVTMLVLAVSVYYIFIIGERR